MSEGAEASPGVGVASRSVGSTWWSVARLVRVPNTLTAATDIVAGVAIASGTLEWDWRIAAAMVASIAFYWGGMALNDVIDVEEDRRTERRRPLVDGSMTLSTARRWAYGLLLLGWLIAAVVTWLGPKGSMFWSPLTMATGLVLVIGVYNSRLKETWLGPGVMGLCRGFNLAFGMSLIAWDGLLDRPGSWLAAHQIFALVGYSLYIAGVTIAARREAMWSRRSGLVLGWLVALIGVGCLGWGPSWVSDPGRLHVDPQRGYWILMGLVTLPVVRRAVGAIYWLDPASVQASIKQAILHTMVLSAAQVAIYAGPMAGLLCCLAIVPSWWMARRFRVT